jgi:asparagine synthase (glutamine-hydrolysing)
VCGICGIVGRKSTVSQEQIGLAALPRMQAAMVHRGPDDEGEFHGAGVALGIRRLSIVDRAGGHQPLSSEDGRIVCVVNGEIYNYRDLRQELETAGHRFRTGSDAEVLPHLFERDGIGGVAHLRGMFAAALYDQRDQSVYLARDPFGIKPLFYAETPTGLVFASELRSIVASGLVDPALDPQSLWDYFTFQYVPDPATLLKGVRKLLPGHYLHYQRGRTQIARYWEPRMEPQEDRPVEVAAQEILQALRQSVAAHRIGEVAIGAYLSGGVDSSLLTALLREHQQVHTYSIGFQGSTGARDELPLAWETAQLLGTTHHEVLVSAGDYADHWAGIVASQEDPVADPSAPALWFLAREARKTVTVVLSGEGSDELFGGYPIYGEPLGLRPFNWLPRSLRTGLGQLANGLPEGMRGKSLLERQALPLEERFLGNARLFTEAEKRALMPDMADLVAPSARLAAPIYAGSGHLDDPTRMQLVDLALWLPGDILMKADKMSMAHSLELRVPFLDPVVFQTASALRTHHRLAAGTTKYALRVAAAKVLPESVAYRTKMGFPVPYQLWLENDLRDLAHDVMQSLEMGTHPGLDVASARSLMTPMGLASRLGARKLWAILTYGLWHRAFLGDAIRETGFIPEAGKR